METAVEIANVIGGFGTLLVAWLVYQFGRQQAARANAMADRQLDLDRQAFRLTLLDRRLSVLSDVREVWTDYMMHARPKPEMIHKLIGALQEAQLIYNQDIVKEMDSVAGYLAQLQRNQVRQKEAREYYDDDKMLRELLEKQFEIEDKLWPVLQPFMERMRDATRVDEPIRSG